MDLFELRGAGGGGGGTVGRKEEWRMERKYDTL